MHSCHALEPPGDRSAWGDYLLRFAGEVLAITVRILTALDWGYIYPMVRPNLFEITLYFVFLFVLLHMRKKIVFALMVLVVLPVILGFGCYAYFERFNNDLRINVIDVGNGDAILVEAPAGMRMLIDGEDFTRATSTLANPYLPQFYYRKKSLP